MVLRFTGTCILGCILLATGCGSNVTVADAPAGTAAGGNTSYSAPQLSSLSPDRIAIKPDFFSAQHFGVSQKIAATQGYATDGGNNFLFSTQEFTETDSHWTTVYTNSKPFFGITIKLAHLGDGEVKDGKIYVPLTCATQQACSPRATAIGVYAADTAGLPLQQWADITSSGCDGSAVAVGPNETLYVSSFFANPGFLCLFDAATLEFKSTLTFSSPIPRIQGISFDAASQRFAMSADSADRTHGYIYFVALNGEVVGPVYTVPQNGELEGLDFTQGFIGYVIQPFDYVYFLYPIQLSGNDFYPASKVVIDGATRQTTYENDQLLDAIVPAAALGGFGPAQVTVTNPTPGGGTSSALPFTASEG